MKGLITFILTILRPLVLILNFKKKNVEWVKLETNNEFGIKNKQIIRLK
jgi:hypothetical protein